MDEFLGLNFPTNDLVAIAATPDDDALFGSSQHESVLSLSGHDVGVGYAGQDLIAGNEGDDSLFGNTETDILYGGKGSDWLFGGEGNDRLWGDLGDDELSGDRGTDTVTGGEGSDRFIIGTGGSTLADADIITDYTDGEDWLELTDGRTFVGLDIQPGTGANTNDTIVQDPVTGEYLAILKDFVASEVLEFADESYTRVRLQIAQDPEPTPEIPDNPPPAGDIEDAPIVTIDREIPQLNTEERSIDTDPGNTPETAYSLPVSSTTLMYSEQVSGADTDDYYVFTLGADNSITLSLEEATGDANISLLDSNQTAIGSSPNTDAISAPLEAGTYYIRVESADAAATDYKLNLSVTPRLAGITTTGSEEEYRLFTNDSLPLINLTPSGSSDTEAFRTDPRFANIDGSGYTAVIIDTGIDLDHPFFGDRIVYSYDFADGDADASDRKGHGSNVSSIVASGDSTYPGVAPGANIIHLKVFGDAQDGASSLDIEQALQWVSNNANDYNIVSVNLSLGSGNFDQAVSGEREYSDEFAQLAEQGIIVVAASGNDFDDSQPGVGYPAADPNVISVGAVWDGDNGELIDWLNIHSTTDYTTDADRITSFTQRHPDLIDIFAPGAFITGANWDGGTVDQGGTSQASPHIAGVAVLAQQLAEQELGRRLTMEEFRTLLQTTGVTINDGDDEDDNVVNTGADYKRVDVLALAEAIVALDAPPPPDPSNLVRYEFTYFYDGYTTDNDYYTGYMYGSPGELQVGTLYDIVQPDIDNEAGFDGYYYITNAQEASNSAQWGEVYVTQYYDVDSSGESYTPYYFQSGAASGFNGIGSEYDFIVADGVFDDFGRDFAEADASGGDDGSNGAVNGLFVSSEYNDRILRFDAETGDLIEVFVPTGSGGLGAPLGLTFGPDDNLYVSSAITDEVLRYDGETGDFLDVFTSGGTLDNPDYLTFGSDGNLYVSSRENDQVLRYDGTTGDFIDVFASGGGLAAPDGLTFGPDGDLFVSSGLTNEILRYDGDTGNFIDVFAFGGGLSYGDGMTFGPDGDLYVTSLDTDEVLRYDGLTGEFIYAFVPEGYGGLDEPTGVTFGSDGNLYVSSNYTDEILRYDGITGEFIDVFAFSPSLAGPVGLAFVD